MKKLLILPLLVLLTACVTYYYPQTALKDGVYYAQDDPSYVINSGAAHYPWYSLDYFYLGYHAYPWYASYYYYPYYPPYYPYYPAWRPWRGHCSNYNGCYRNYRGTGREYYAGSDYDYSRNHGNERGYGDESPVYYRSRQAGGDVRYRSGAKETQSRTGPVETSGPSKGITINTQPPQHGTSSRQTRSAPPSRSNSRSHSRPPPSASSFRSRGSSPGKSSPSEHLD